MSKRNKDEEYDEYYDEDEKRLSLMKRLGITILIIIGIIILFLLLRSCGKFNGEKNLNTLLLEAGKEYYEYNDYLLPDSIGECQTVSLATLVKEGLIDKNKYSDCGNDTTYVKVCKLESGKYHFVEILDCETEKTEGQYGEWNEGKESDIKSDSDIKFTYQVSYLNTENANLGDVEDLWEDEITYSKYKTEQVIKYYRYKDLQYIWNVTSKQYYPGDKTNASNVKEYYISSPSKEYTNKDSENNSVSKYFSTTEEKIYWVTETGVKKVSTKAPDSEYIYSDNPIYQTRYQTRAWRETSKPVAVGPTQMWYCSSPTKVNQVTSYVPCEQNVNNPEFTVTERMIYTCDGGITEVGKNGTCYQCTDGSGLRTDRSSCGSYGEWGNFSTTACDTSSDLCQSRTITAYNWYKLGAGKRKYYPSNSETASGENTYYAEAPQSGLIKDGTTTTTGWKWYKKTETQTQSYYTTSPQTGATKTSNSKWTNFTSWSTTKPASLGTSGTRVIETKNKIKLREILGEGENWITFNNDFMELNPLLKALQDKGYKVYSLDDINANGELKYKIKLYIRNKEVK